MTLWSDEHGADYDVPEQVTDTLRDVSWHNDTSPSFVRPDDKDTEEPDVRLWVEHPDPDEREGSTERYSVTDSRQNDPVYEGDDLDAALAALWNVQ